MWSICGVNCEIPFKKTSVNVSFTREWQSDILRQIQGDEGSKEEQELTAEDQQYPDNWVEVLLVFMWSHFQGQTQLIPHAASHLESWSQSQILLQIPPGFRASDKAE